MTATRRQLQYDDTHRRLFDVAVRLMSKSGYHATTVQDIAKAAGVAKGTFFLHFSTKDAVVIELLRRHASVARAARSECLAGGGSPLDALRIVVTSLAGEMGNGSETLRSLLAAMVSSDGVGRHADALLAQIVADMVTDARNAQKARLLASKPAAESIARSLIALYFGAALRFATSGEPRDEFAKVVRSHVDDNLAVLTLEGGHASPKRR
ncbi:MAG: TetR/AcrR family transcriptional regulator [Candidatus Eremiobacteraeota bacterium]|nr:TetR/AcrR family transcriptional regulator [Candidatus Eremiobacteraeota bacterium]